MSSVQESGYTGLSILYRLHYLYGFLYDRHLVYDEMHTVHLNIVKNAVLSLKEEGDDTLDWATADKRLKDFPWTTEFKRSRIPRDMEKRLGYWEERYAILLEDRRGTTACTMIVHNLLHFKEDTRNFSGQDSYSCWNKERAVSRYVHHPNNHKNIEHTFANTEELHEALKFRKEPKEQRPDPQKTDPNKPWAKSIEQAQKLYCTHEEVHLQADLTGILTLDARVHHTIANEQCVLKILKKMLPVIVVFGFLPIVMMAYCTEKMSMLLS